MPGCAPRRTRCAKIAGVTEAAAFTVEGSGEMLLAAKWVVYVLRAACVMSHSFNAGRGSVSDGNQRLARLMYIRPLPQVQRDQGLRKGFA